MKTFCFITVACTLLISNVIELCSQQTKLDDTYFKINHHPLVKPYQDSISSFNKIKRKLDSTEVLQRKAIVSRMNVRLADYIIQNCSDSIIWHLLHAKVSKYGIDNWAWVAESIDSSEVCLSLAIVNASQCLENVNYSNRIINGTVNYAMMLLSRYYYENGNYITAYHYLNHADSTVSKFQTCGEGTMWADLCLIKTKIGVLTGVDSIQVKSAVKHWFSRCVNYSDTLHQVMKRSYSASQIHTIADSALRSVRPKFKDGNSNNATGVVFDFLGKTYTMMIFNTSDTYDADPIYNARYKTPNQLDIDYYKELFKNSEYYKVLVGE